MSIFISYIVLNGKSKLNVWWFEATKLFISAPRLLALKLNHQFFLHPLFTVYRRVENENFSHSLLISFSHVCDKLKHADNHDNSSCLTAKQLVLFWMSWFPTDSSSFGSYLLMLLFWRVNNSDITWHHSHTVMGRARLKHMSTHSSSSWLIFFLRTKSLSVVMDKFVLISSCYWPLVHFTHHVLMLKQLPCSALDISEVQRAGRR